MLHSLITGLLLVGLSASPPSAQSSPPERTRILYEKAMADAAAGAYDEAALGFDVAYRFSGVSMLLWNAARAYQRAGDLTSARQRYYACTQAADLPLSRRRQAAYLLEVVEETLRGQSRTALPPLRVPEAYMPRVHPPSSHVPPRDRRRPERDINLAAADAQPGGHRQGYPVRFTARPLTLPEQTLGLSGGVGAGVVYRDVDGQLVLEDGTEAPGVFATSALSYGVLDILEFGTVFLSLEAFPEAIYDEPSLYGIVSIWSSGGYEIGAMVEVVAGVQSGSPWSLSVGSPSTLQYKWFRMDTGIYLDLEFGDPGGVSMRLPLHLHAQFTDGLYGSIFAGTIVSHTEIDGERLETVTHPFGVGLAYTFEMSGRPLCDLQAYFVWPFLHGTDSDSAWLHTDTFMTGLAARFFIDL